MSVAGNIVIEMELDNDRMIVGVKQAGAVLRQFQTQLGQTARSVKRLEEANDSLSTKFRNLVLTMGNLRFVAMDINDIFLRLPVSILRTAGELERMQVLMTGLSKETNRAAQAAEGLRDFNYITNFAKTAPFEINALADSFVKLKTAGIEPSVFAMKALTDSVARFGGNGESLKRASVAIQQMAGKGVVSMEELRQQLGEAVPTAMQAMADGMGVSMADLAKIIQTGTLQAGPALEKMFVMMRVQSDGAAAAMMNTWAGQLAQLKTEWELTAKFIADNGFGDSAKQAVSSITEALRTPEFQLFAREAGAALGSTVTSLVDAAKFIIKFRDEIKLLVEAWIAYKLIFSLIIPASQAMNDGIGRTITKLREEGTAIANNTRNRQASAAEAAIQSRNESMRRQIDLAKVLAGHNAELASVERTNAAILASKAALQSKLRALQAQEAASNANNYSEQRRTATVISELSAKSAELIQRQNTLNKIIPETASVLRDATAATVAKTTQVNALAGASRMATAGSIALAGATKALGAAYSFIGGPVGAAVLAITTLVWWFDRSAQSAEEAAARIKRAMNNMANAEDVTKLQADLAKAQANLRGAKAAAEDDTDLGRGAMGKKSSERRAREAKELLAAEAEVVRIQGLIGQASKTVQESASREYVDRTTLAATREIAKIKEQGQLKTLAIEKSYQQELESVKGNAKKTQEVRNKITDEQQQAMLSNIRRQINYEELLQDRANKSAQANDKTRAGDLQIASQSRARMEALQAEQKGIEDAIKRKVEYKPKVEKKTGGSAESKYSEIDELIKRLSGERAGLDAELANWGGTSGKADEVAGIIAKMQADFDSGRITDAGGKKPSTAKQQRAIQEAVDKANRDKEIKDLEKNAEKVKAVTDYVDGMRPELEDAMDLLKDPMGVGKVGAAEKRSTKWISENLDKIKAAAEDTGKSAEKIQNEIMANAYKIDDSKTFATIVQDTATMNAALVEDTRNAAKARMDAENEEFRNYMQRLIDKREASGQVSKEEIDRMKQQLADNMKARAATTAQKSKSPMEQLAAEWQNTTKNMEQATARWGQQAMDVFTNAALTGKLEFADMARSILADMAKIAMQKAMGAAVSSATNFAATAASAFFFADGGIMSSAGSMPLKKYAKGGVANSPQMAIFAEAGMAEAFVPLPDGRSIPVTMTAPAGAGQGGDNVVVQINVTEGGSSTSTASGDSTGFYQQLGERVKAVVQQELATQMRPGGVLAR